MSGADRRARRALASQWRRERELPPSTVTPSVLAAAAGVVAMWPYTSAIQPGAWSLAVIAVIAATALTGIAARTLLRHRSAGIRDLVTITAQTVVAAGTVIQLVAGGTALFGVIPTGSTVQTFQALASAAWEQIVYGAAPLPPSAGLTAAMGSGFAVVAVLLDQLVSQRGAVLAFLLTAVVGAIPMIATAAGADVAWFVMLGILLLLILRVTATQNPSSPRRSSTAVAAGVGVAAIAATAIVAPVIPVSATLAGTGAGITVDASLRLGDDLRRPNPVEVLTLATTADTAPYLRLTTLSRFDGRVWRPDQGDPQPQSEGFGPAEWGDDIAVEEQTTSIRVIRMSSSWLPMPYPATGIQGVTDAWRVDQRTRTVSSRSADAVGNDYTVRSVTVKPTLEQIRAISAAPPEDRPEADLPPIIARTAQEVTTGATNDYDRLIAMQSWFRSEFEYSLDTPVDEGFDGNGADAVARFLEVRSGYCIHFAGAFALMADSLGMDVRIVVGYLPGRLTSTTRGDDAVYSVSSDQLHSWPEVRFPGIGWVPFEPTATLGVPTGFAPGQTAGGGGVGTPSSGPTTAPTVEATSAPPVDRADAGDAPGATGQPRRLDPAPVVLTALGGLVVVLLPSLARLAVRARRRRRAARGDAASAWAELRATMLDLGVPLSDAETPRERRDELVRDSGVDADAMRTLTDAVERASYARPDPDRVVGLDAALGEALRGLRRSVDGRSRVRAFLLPRSLVTARDTDAAAVA